MHEWKAQRASFGVTAQYCHFKDVYVFMGFLDTYCKYTQVAQSHDPFTSMHGVLRR